MQHDDLLLLAELWGPHNTCLAVWHHTSGKRFWAMDSGTVFENDYFNGPDDTSLNKFNTKEIHDRVAHFDASDDEKQAFLDLLK